MTAGQTLERFVTNLGRKKGLEKNLCAKKYINRIEYSPQEISISLYYKRALEERSMAAPTRDRVAAISCSSSLSEQKKSPKISPKGFKLAPHSMDAQTINVIVYNTIHNCKKKNIHVVRQGSEMRS